MNVIQRLWRRNQTVDPIRESTAMTTVYLLEMNRKFELFVRAKIEELEGVVTGLEARAASQQEAWDDEAGRGQETSLPSEVVAEPAAETDTPGAGETVAFDPPADGDSAAGLSLLPELVFEPDEADYAGMVAFDPTAGAEPSAEPSSLPEVAVGYQSLGSAGDDSGIALIDPTAGAADEAALTMNPGGHGRGIETAFAGDAAADVVADDDETADLEPWERSMGFGVKGAFD